MTNYVTFGGGTLYFAIFYENLGSGIYCELLDNKDGNVYTNNLGSQAGISSYSRFHYYDQQFVLWRVLGILFLLWNYNQSFSSLRKY